MSWIPDLPWPLLLIVALTVVAGYAVFGATGFGSAVIGAPVLAWWFPLTTVLPLLTTLDLAATWTSSAQNWRQADRSEFRRMLPMMLLGVAAGIALLVKLPREALMGALGVFAIAFGVRQLLPGWRAGRLAPGWGYVFGFVGGVFSVIFGSGGPVHVIYLATRIADKTKLRATISALVTVSITIRFLSFLVTGLLLRDGLLVLAAWMMPLMFAGYLAGRRLHHRMSNAAFLKTIAVLLVGNGMLLLVRAVGG